MHPDNGFPPTSRLVNLPMLSRLIGTTPFKLLSIRYMRVTLPSESVSTPYHSLRGASLSQLRLSVQFEPSVASYSRTSASLSVAGDCTSGGRGKGTGVGVRTGVAVGPGVGVVGRAVGGADVDVGDGTASSPSSTKYGKAK